MEVRNMIENISNIVEILQGAGCLFLAGAVGLACCLWRKRKAFLTIMLLTAGLEFMVAADIQAADICTEIETGMDEEEPEEAIREIYITGFQRKEDSEWEEEGLWLYNTQAEILLLLEEKGYQGNEEPDEEEYPGNDKTEGVRPGDDGMKEDLLRNRNELQVQVWNLKDGWVNILQDEWTKYGIEFAQDAKNREVWYLRISQEMHCRILFEDEERNCRQQQELVIDWTAPSAKTVSILGTESKREPVVINGVRYAGESLQICMDIQDENRLRSVRCEGYADGDTKIFEEDCTHQDGYSCIVPLDFRGYLRWYIKDICGNETVYGSDSHFCTESRETCIANSQIMMERCDEMSDYCRESMVLRFFVASNWSGISAIRIQEGATILLEEEMSTGRITQWERILTVTPQSEGNTSILVTVTSLTGQTVSATRSWIKDVTAPQVRTEWEGKSRNGYFSTSGTLCIILEETHFAQELWNIEYTCPTGKEEKIKWDVTGSGIYQCRIPFSEDGEYSLRINGMDPAGNAMVYGKGNSSGPVSISWVVDTKSPRIMISGVENAKHYGQMPEITIRMEDANPDFDKLKWYLSGSETEQVVCTASQQEKEIQLSFPEKPKDDTYHLQVEGYDLAGNYTKKNMSFTVNEKGSFYQTEGLGEKSTFTVGPKLEVIEMNKSPIIEYQIVYIWEGTVRLLTEGEDYQVEKTEGTDYQNRYIFSKDLFQKEGYYSITVISKDAAGNSMSTQKNGYAYVPIRFSVDKTAPIILLEEMKSQDSREQGLMELQMQILENQNLKELHIRTNGKEIFPEEDGKIQLDAGDRSTVLQIEAEDAAGNKVYMEKRFERSEEVSPDSKTSDKLHGENGTGSVHAAVTAGIVLILLISLILFFFWKKKACIGNFPML